METKSFVIINNIKYPIFDLTNKEIKTSNQTKLESFKNSLSDFSKDESLKKGDIIHIISGANNDMVYRVVILGFNDDEIFINWNCYWFPIKKDRILDPKLIENTISQKKNSEELKIN